MKKTLLFIASIVLAVALSVSGTIAYLTSTDSAVNVMVVGNIEIEQYEQDRNGNDFVQGQTIMPLVTPASVKDAAGYPACDNYFDKIVTVKNTGKNDAYVRTFVAIPSYSYEGKTSNNASANVIHWNGYSAGDAAPNYPIATRIPGTTTDVANTWVWGKDANSIWPGNGGEWNTFKTVIDGQTYDVYVITSNAILEPGAITAPNFTGFYLDSNVDFDGEYFTYEGKKIEGMTSQINILVASQAVQAAGWDDSFTALDTAFGVPATDCHPWVNGIELPVIAEDADDVADAFAANKNVVLTADVALDAQVSTNGKVLDGGNHTVTANVPRNNNGGTVPAIHATAGTVKNVNVIGGDSRGIGTTGNLTGDLVVENVFVDDTVYALHVAKGNGYALSVKNSTFYGWCSFGGDYSALSFEGCTFGKGQSDYQMVRVYDSAVFVNCNFETGTTLDLDGLVDGETVVLINCTINGQPIPFVDLDGNSSNGAESPNFAGIIVEDADRAQIVVINN